MTTPLRSLAKSIYYKIAESLFFRKGVEKKFSGISVVFPYRYSNFYNSHYDQDKIHFLAASCKEGNTVIDIGAHIGLFSIILGKLVGTKGKVYSFEPADNNRKALIETISLNHMNDLIRVHKELISNENKLVDFYINNNSVVSNANSLYKSNDGNTLVKSESITLDHFTETQNTGKIDVIKIDAEGAELSILEGAVKTISKHRPVISMEVHPGMSDRPDFLISIWNISAGLKYLLKENENLISQSDFLEKTEPFEIQMLPQ